MLTHLPFFPASGRSLLSVRDTPVWPVAGPEELSGLQSLTQLFGRAMVHYGDAFPSVRAAAVDSTRGKVVGIGTSVHFEAQLYAHLTGREAMFVDSTAALRSLSSVAIVITTPERVTPTLLATLEEVAIEGSVAGLLIGDGPELRRQVLFRAA